MTNCPNDGGFLGEGGCTHPNHEHSPLVKKLLTADQPERMSVSDCDTALDEGFTVKSADGTDTAFGKSLKVHLDAHTEKDANNRKQCLAYAVDAVKTTQPETNHRGIPGRKAYAKSYKDFGIITIADKNNTIDEVFTIVRKRKGKTK